ncbi:hypothetical protein MNBD_NITROSPINAE01-1621, partial [hydrothermal vent metagenome]
MNFYETGSHVAEVAFELKNLASGKYPRFVTKFGNGWKLPEIPVFSFHDVHPEKFEAQLKFLQDNGYETLNATEYGACSNGSGDSGRKVLLTFDDGRDSLWTVAYPLLKKYKMKAVAFVLPGEIKDAEAPRRTFDGSYGDIENDDELCSWPEVEAMGDVIDVQSHSDTHFIMFTSSKVVDFFSPRIKQKWMEIEWPVINSKTAQRDYGLGTPFYEMDSRLSGSLRMLEPEPIREACQQFVKENGNEQFFNRKNWFSELSHVHNEALSKAVFKTETAEQKESAIRKVLANSKKTLEEKLGKQIEHLCLPFGIGGETTLKLAGEA